jgi:hypothetical protein
VLVAAACKSSSIAHQQQQQTQQSNQHLQPLLEPWQPDPAIVADIKAIAKRDPALAVSAASMALQKLSTSPSSEHRLGALALLATLFPRSAAVRAAVTADLRTFLTATVGADSGARGDGVPGPEAAAAALRSRALALLEGWAAEHGDAHRELRAAYR